MLQPLTQKYATFTGRASRSEFWLFWLFCIVVSVVLSFVDLAVGAFSMDAGIGLLSGIFALAIIVPSLAVAFRRMHDTDRTAWWLLIALIPFIGAIVLLVFYVLKGTDGNNQYGPDPLANQ
jgi:uncharacterized membrane protein YhaH (DUF805 family)